MDANCVEGAPVPPPGNVRWHRVIWPAFARPQQVVFLTHKFIGVWTHFVGGRTRPCRGEGVCQECAYLHSQYSGFAGVWSDSLKDVKVLMLSEQAARQTVALVQAHGPLRGMKLRYTREAGKCNSPVNAEFLRRSEKNLDSFPPFDLWPSIGRFFGVCPDFRPTVQPPLPEMGRIDHTGAHLLNTSPPPRTS